MDLKGIPQKMDFKHSNVFSAKHNIYSKGNYSDDSDQCLDIFSIWLLFAVRTRVADELIRIPKVCPLQESRPEPHCRFGGKGTMEESTLE